MLCPCLLCFTPELEPQQSSPRFEFGSNTYSNFGTASQSPQAHQQDDISHSPSANVSASGSGSHSTSKHAEDTATVTGPKNVDSRIGKRRYAASCEVCRRRKRRCDGREENGESLCKFCPQAGIQWVFPRCVVSRCRRRFRSLTNGLLSVLLFKSTCFYRSSEASRLESVSAAADASHAFIEQLASAGDDDRERMLMEWTKQRDEGELSKPVVSTKTRRKIVKKEEVEQEKLEEVDDVPEVRTFLYFGFFSSGYRLD